MAGRKPTSARERFVEKCAPPDENGCVLWTGGRTSNDPAKAYGVFYADGQMRPAHRWNFEQAYGKLSSDLDACHKCDVRLCVTLGHLFPGTRKENMQDAVRKGRTSHLPRNVGDKHPMARLTEVEVIQMREWHAAGWPMRELSNTYDVSFAQVSRIINRTLWKHV